MLWCVSNFKSEIQNKKMFFEFGLKIHEIDKMNHKSLRPTVIQVSALVIL